MHASLARYSPAGGIPWRLAKTTLRMFCSPDSKVMGGPSASYLMTLETMDSDSEPAMSTVCCDRLMMLLMTMRQVSPRGVTPPQRGLLSPILIAARQGFAEPPHRYDSALSR